MKENCVTDDFGMVMCQVKSLAMAFDAPFVVLNLSSLRFEFVDDRIAGFLNVASVETGAGKFHLRQLYHLIPAGHSKIAHELCVVVNNLFMRVGDSNMKEYVVRCNFPILNPYFKSVHLRISQLVTPKSVSDILLVCIVTIGPSYAPARLFIEDVACKSRICCNDNAHLREKMDKPIALSTDEQLILRLSLAGLSTVEISEKMHRGVDTVKYHMKRINRKLGVSHMQDAISIAIILHLI